MIYLKSHLQLKKEQERRTELADREGILRTKAMREREEQKSRRKYRYCLIRFNFNFDHHQSVL